MYESERAKTSQSFIAQLLIVFSAVSFVFCCPVCSGGSLRRLGCRGRYFVILSTPNGVLPVHEKNLTAWLWIIEHCHCANVTAPSTVTAQEIFTLIGPKNHLLNLLVRGLQQNTRSDRRRCIQINQIRQLKACENRMQIGYSSAYDVGLQIHIR